MRDAFGRLERDTVLRYELEETPSAFALLRDRLRGKRNKHRLPSLTSLMLNHHGHSLTEIGFSHAFHSAGMFAFSQDVMPS